jgi:hypothetical protein
MIEKPQVALRQRTFLKGTLYYDNRRASIECTIRDMSDSGARLTFEHPVTVPDTVEVFIRHKQQTLQACVRRRAPEEIGIEFAAGNSTVADGGSDADLQQRIEMLEAELSALKRLVAKLRAKEMPYDLDAA